MSDYRGQHSDAVNAAIIEVAKLQEYIAMATEQCDVAVGAILVSTGATQVESARNAMDFIAGCKDRLDEMYGITMNAVLELERYRGGF